MSGKQEFTSKRLIRLPVNDVADCVLVLKKSQTIHIFGNVSLRKLAGSLSIYGHNLDDGNWHSVCSCGPHLITLECSSSWQHISLSNALEEIDNEKNKLAIKKFTKNPKDIGCILLLKSLRLTTKLQCEDLFHLSAILDISSFDRRQKVLHEKTSDLHFTVFLDVPAPLSPLIMSPEWQSIPSFIQSQSTDKGSSSSVILICGGKGVGKSTFARYMINKLLNTQRPLYFLDTDVGQSEFTPPGVLSLNKIDTPVFGPPFSHLSRSEKACFFGDVSPKDRPSSYIRLINVLYQYYKEFYSGTPLIVNTHGWVKGMGVRILLNIIGIVQPTHIIQINSKSQPTKNLPELNKEFLQNESGWNYRINEERDTSEEDWGCSSHIYQMDAFACTTEGIKGVNLQASELRALSLLSYFGSSQNPSSSGSIPDYILNHCAVYSQSISNLKLFNVSEDVPPSQMLYSMNASVVGLVKLDTNMVYSSDSIAMDSRLSDDVLFGEYLGLGIVRNIDPANGVLFIITPEPLHNICKVNALVKGKLEIPDCLLKKRKCENLPYLTSEFTYNHKGSGQKRVRYNLLRQKSRSPHSTDQ